jgi:hypothetical protein
VGSAPLHFGHRATDFGDRLTEVGDVETDDEPRRPATSPVTWEVAGDVDFAL